jgi:hypothetical protein
VPPLTSLQKSFIFVSKPFPPQFNFSKIKQREASIA